MEQSKSVEVNDEVLAAGHTGRFVVVELEGITASLQLFGDDTRNGGRIYFEKTISVPASTLTVIGKNHKRPSTYRVCR